MKNKVLELLKANKGKHLKGKDIIREIFKANSVALKELEVRKIINELRNEGEPIIADSLGYEFVDSHTKLQEYIAKRKYEIKKECITLNKMCIKSGIQLSIFDMEELKNE